MRRIWDAGELVAALQRRARGQGGAWKQRRDPTRGRARALREEVDYWRDWLTSAGGEWPADFAYRFDPSAEMADPLLRQIVAAHRDETVHVLDVGAGPVSAVGYTIPGKTLELVAVDPLASRYDRLLDKAGLVPPVRVREVAGEALVDAFGPNRFDVAYARNALDHAVDPWRIVDNMLTVVRPGGYVVLRHSRNEGVRQDYVQLHQWNFDKRDGHLVVWRDRQDVDITSLLGDRAEVLYMVEGATDDDPGWLLATIRKPDRVPLP